MASETRDAATLDRDEAFEALRTVCERFSERGRLAKSGSVKSVLLMHCEKPFSEQDLGFETFRAFLQAAERAGVVHLTPSGPDVVVVASGSDPVPPERPSSDRFRREVWAAFVKWGSNSSERFWHRTERRIVQRHAPADGLVPVDVISKETMLRIMSAYVDHQPDATQPGLRDALKSAMPFRGFSEAVKRAGIADDWSRSQAAEIGEHIRQWATVNEVPVSELLARSTPRPLPPPPAPAPPTVASNTLLGGEPGLEQRRFMLHGYVDQMTEAEMLVLPIPLRIVWAKN